MKFWNSGKGESNILQNQFTRYLKTSIQRKKQDLIRPRSQVYAHDSYDDSWQDIRGLKTLDLRVKRHSANALKVAEWLESQPSDVIERVWYPGLESHPGHEIAARQMHGGFGGIVSVQLAAGAEAAKHFVDHTQIFTLAESLGGVESLIEVPAAMTHASVAGTTLQVPANLVRISVGIENADDLIADLKQALDRI